MSEKPETTGKETSEGLELTGQNTEQSGSSGFERLVEAEEAPEETRKKKKWPVILVIIVILLAAGAGAVWYFLVYSARQEGMPAGGGIALDTVSAYGEDVVTATGSTSVGMELESFEIDYIDTELEIAEVYLSSQDEVEAGDAILRLTDESVSEARKELEEEATQADLDYRQALLDGEEEKITAKQTYDTSIINGNYASYTMEESLKTYADKIAELEEQVEEQQELVDEYTASVESDYYYTYYEIAELKEEYESSFQALMSLYEMWDIPTLEDHNTSSGSGSGSLSGSGSGSDSDSDSASSGMSGMGGGSSSSSGADKIEVYDTLDEEVQENEAAYEAALEEYEEAKENAEAGLPQAQVQLELLQIQLEEAQIQYDKQLVISQTDYENTMSTYEAAQETYELEIERIEEEISVALSAKEEAEENLEEFESTIGDGYLYAQSSGTVMMVGVREEDVLTGNSIVLAYSDTNSISVTASVAQADIAQVYVGETAVVIFSDYGNFDGVVTSINPISTSSSQSSITYSVNVDLSGDVSSLSQNLSATVYFGVSLTTQTTEASTEEAVQEDAEETAAEETAVEAEETAAEETALDAEASEAEEVTQEEEASEEVTGEVTQEDASGDVLPDADPAEGEIGGELPDALEAGELPAADITGEVPAEDGAVVSDALAETGEDVSIEEPAAGEAAAATE